MIKVYLLTRHKETGKIAQAYMYCKCIARENKRSIRFMDLDGKYFTLKKDNIITIEKEGV